eukprot:6192574-Pleurochrysis_carterae.AAC.2
MYAAAAGRVAKYWRQQRGVVGSDASLAAPGCAETMANVSKTGWFWHALVHRYAVPRKVVEVMPHSAILVHTQYGVIALLRMPA